MHPQSGTTKGVLILCMVILGILLLPLPFTAYKILKFFLSLFLLYTAGFFLRPRKNLMFTPSNDRVEVGTRNPSDGAFTGKLKVSTTYEDVADLTEENSQLVRFLDNAHFLCERKSLPPISLKVSLGLVIAAVVMNPLTRVHMPRVDWMFLDVVVLGLLAYAVYLINEENDGKRPAFSLTRTIGQPPEFPFMGFNDTCRQLAKLWPAIAGGAFVIGLLGTQIGGGKFEDIHLGYLVLMQMPIALGASLFIAVMIYQFMGAVANKDVAETARREQVPGEFSITVIALIYIAFALGGHFTAVPEEERTGPAFNDRYDP